MDTSVNDKLMEPSTERKKSSGNKMKDCKKAKDCETITHSKSKRNNSLVSQDSKNLSNEIHNSLTGTSSEDHELLRENSPYSMLKDNNLKRQYSTPKSNISNVEELLSKESSNTENVFSILIEEANVINTDSHGFKDKVRKDTAFADEFKGKYIVDVKTDETKNLIDKKANQGFDEEKQAIAEKIKPRRHRRTCLCVISVFSCVMSALAIILVVGLLTGKTNPYQLPDSHHGWHSGKAEATSTLVDSGSFKLDQEYLKASNKIRWSPDEYSHIHPSGDGGCLQVPVGGKYLVVSRFTFDVSPGEEHLNVFHFFTVLEESGQMKEASYRRKLVSVTQEKSGLNKKIVIIRKHPSVFTEFIELEARQQICANVSRADLLYKSSLDNDLNIIRV